MMQVIVGIESAHYLAMPWRPPSQLTTSIGWLRNLQPVVRGFVQACGRTMNSAKAMTWLSCTDHSPLTPVLDPVLEHGASGRL